jgi:hypothetical protein
VYTFRHQKNAIAAALQTLTHPVSDLPRLCSQQLSKFASTLPNIYDEKQLTEFAASSECPKLTDDEIERIASLYDANFGIQDDEPPKFKGTMELAETGTR